MILYRPVGLNEYLLIKGSGFREFPPRLQDQPIFYPVTNKEYASEIASEWNTKDAMSDFLGIVLKFNINDDFIRKFEKKVVGGSHHEEYWIPANDLADFNNHIIDTIEVIEVYYGENYTKEKI